MANNNGNPDKLFNITEKQHVLVVFNALYDLDIGLIELVRKEYASKEVFNYEKLYQPNLSLLEKLYKRKDLNPLYLIANDDISKEELDSFRDQFYESKYEDICKYSVYTDVLNLVNIIRNTSSNNLISVEIGYYNDKQKAYLESDDNIKGIKFTDLRTIYENKETAYKYDFVYISELNDLLQLLKLESSIVYIADFYRNLNDDRTDYNFTNKALEVFLLLDRNNELGIYQPYTFQNEDDTTKENINE